MLVIDNPDIRPNVLSGRNLEFEQLILAKDIDTLKSKMQCQVEEAEKALEVYNVRSHKVMKREDKIITKKKRSKDRQEEYIERRTEEVWKLPLAYPQYINEIALVFLFGRPVKWLQSSDGTDEAFAKFQSVIKSTRFDSRIREAKRIAGAEKQSAMLWHTYRNKDGKADVLIRVLAASKGDEIYSRWDQYGNLLTAAWGYYVLEEKDQTIYHFDIFTPEYIYRCAQRQNGWEVVKEINFVGKIPLIIFRQEMECAGVERLIDREEYIISHTADTNDYFADPAMVMCADVINNMPEKKDDNKTFVVKNGANPSSAIAYVTWDSAPDSKKMELEWLQEHILSKTFTPKISLDTLKSLSNLSAKALRTVMMLADIKASKNKEIYGEMIDRTGSLVKAIIGRVLDVSLASQCDSLIIDHEFSEPFGEDVVEDINNLVQCLNNGLMSEETAIESNPLIKDSTREKERLNAEKEDRLETQQNIFGMGDSGAQSYTDGSNQQPNEGKTEKERNGDNTQTNNLQKR